MGTISTPGFHSVPSKVRAVGDVAVLLGWHLSSAMRFKILQGEYVNLFSLLNTADSDDRDREREDDEDKETRSHKKPDHSWGNWLAA